MLNAIAQVLYSIVVLAVLCVGVFSLTVTKTERKAYSLEQLENQPKFKRWDRPKQREYEMYKKITNELIMWIVVVAIFWPIAVPLYLAWRKGDMINTAMEKRAKNLESDG